MAGGMKQTMSQIQTLRMTPQLQQAIKLLQLSRMELETTIRKELEENPVLEELAENNQENAETEAEKNVKEELPATTDTPQDPRGQDEFEWDSYIESQYKPPMAASGGEEIMNYENLMTTEQSLFDYLLWQVGLYGFNEEEEKIATIIINYIDEVGYIRVPLEQIAEEEKISVRELEEILPFVQEFDPPGVGARDLKECLLIQAKHLEEDTHQLMAIINNHLKDLEKKNYDAIAKAMNIPLNDVIEMCKIILNMDPKPGKVYLPQDTHYVTPDVYVYKVGDLYTVSLNEDGLPRLRISNFYKNVLSNKNAKDPTQEYIHDKLRSAIWLIKSIQQRQRTIYKVTESIVKHQQEFFEKGPGFIKPMILKDVANDIGMHESTVSRVTTSKFVHTPRGIFELKYFFNSGINKTDGDSLASESVKMKIKALVDKENTKSPLSDQKIVELLKKDGIEIARRTVAKYREMLKILPSSKRKKFF